MQKFGMIWLLSVVCIGSCSGMILHIHPLKNGEVLTRDLFKSIRDYNYEQTAALIQKHRSLVNTYAYDEQQREKVTPLHVAALVGNSTALTLLIKSKAIVNALTREKENIPLHLAYNKKVAKILIRNGACIDQINTRHHTPLYEALFSSDRPFNYDVAHCLVVHGADVNQRLGNYSNDTLLHKAVCKNGGFFKSAQFLLEHNADPEKLNTRGKTPFSVAIASQDRDLINLFKTVGILFFRIPTCEENPFELLELFALSLEREKKYGQEISNDNDRAQKICVKKGENLYTDYIFKNVSFADLEKWAEKDIIDYVRNDFVMACELALSYAQGHDYDSLKRTIVRYPFVVSYDKDIAFELLIECMAQQNGADMLDYVLSAQPNVNGVDREGNTLLHRAIEYKNGKAIRGLIGVGIDCSVRNKHGQTVLDLLDSVNDIESFGVFYHAFSVSFLSTINRKMHRNSEKLLSHENFYGYRIRYIDRTLLLPSLGNRPEKCLTLLKHGAEVNVKDGKGISPLFLVIKNCVGRSWDETSPQYKYIVRLLLERGAEVDERIIQSASPDYMRQLLQQTYDKQSKCSVCFKKKALIGVLCKNKQGNTSLCKICYDKKPECCICFEFETEALIDIPCANKHGDISLCKNCFIHINICPFCRVAW